MGGVFAAGVLDAFHDKRFRPFQAYYGSSAGAINLTYFLSGQRGRNLEIYSQLSQDAAFISFSRFLKRERLFDFDAFFERIQQQHSFHLPRLRHTLSSSQFYAVTTCLDDDSPSYLSIGTTTGPQRLLQVLKASCALPMIYRDSVTVDGQIHMDGSLSDPLPVIQALADGFKDITLIRTRPVDRKKKASTSDRLLAWQYRNQPAVSQMIRRQHCVYNRGLDDLSALELRPDVNLFQVAPKKTLSTGHYSRNRAALVADYHQGYTEGYAFVEKLTKPLKKASPSSAKLIESS